MKKLSKNIIVFSPIGLVLAQFLCNLMFFINKDSYFQHGFYLNAFFGINTWIAVFLFVFTSYFNFCSISRTCAISELIAAGVYLIIQEDNVYNNLIQAILFGTALIITALLFTVRTKEKSVIT
jgi:uncharacterized membrane protein